jgi:hypothetical protein
LSVLEVDDGVIALAERIERSYGPAVLAIAVESPLDQDVVFQQTSAAVGSLRAGEVHWSVDADRSGVVIRQWGHVADAGAMVRALCRACGEHGVEGRLVEHAQGQQPTRPRQPELVPLGGRELDLLECHIRVRGERRLFVPDHELQLATRQNREPQRSTASFFPDDDALLAGVEAALAWIGSPPAGTELSLWGSHRDVGEVQALIARRFAQVVWRQQAGCSVWWETENAFRLAVLRPEMGDISLAEGGTKLEAGEWEPAYDALLHALRSTSPWAAYGLIKRGRQPRAVGNSLVYDWVPATHYGSHYHTVDHTIYEDVLAPDAFGAQLLGPGYAGRIPMGADWQKVEIDDDAALLTHRDPEAWFGRPLPPINHSDPLWRSPDYPMPEVIRRARTDLAPILAHHDVVSRRPVDPLAG